jgi:threonine synthase
MVKRGSRGSICPRQGNKGWQLTVVGLLLTAICQPPTNNQQPTTNLPMIHCTNCNLPYPENGTPYRCPTCGGIYDFASPISFDPQEVETSLPGIWRYRRTFLLPEKAPVTTLGEGNTPLIWSKAFRRELAFKLEFLNPTGSFKDRGTAPLISFLMLRRVTEAVEDSSGNAGASFAAYAAATGIKARIFVPEYASGPKRTQIEAYGAEVVRVPGPRSNTAEAVQRSAAKGSVYASHAYLPHVILGFATVAYELVEQLGTAPGTVISPAGQGSLLLGVGRGFEALQIAGIIRQMPVLVGAQALACAPLWAASVQGERGIQQVNEGQTLAEGVRIRHPLRMNPLLQVVAASGGRFCVIREENILSGQSQLALRGMYVEPTSAIVWDALEQVVGDVPEPIVMILTGSGLKAVI